MTDDSDNELRKACGKLPVPKLGRSLWPAVARRIEEPKVFPLVPALAAACALLAVGLWNFAERGGVPQRPAMVAENPVFKTVTPAAQAAGTHPVFVSVGRPVILATIKGRPIDDERGRGILWEDEDISYMLINVPVSIEDIFKSPAL